MDTSNNAPAAVPGTRGLTAVALWVTVALGSGLSMIGYSYIAQIRSIEGGFSERVELMLDVLETGVRAHLHNNKYHPVWMGDILVQIASAPLMLGAGIQDAEGTLILGRGEIPDAPQADRPNKPFIEVRGTAISSPQPEGHGPGLPRGPSAQAGWLPFPPPPHQLFVVLDSQRYHQQIARARGVAVIAAVVVLLFTLLGSAAILLWFRQYRLQTLLSVSRERARQQERLAQLGAGLAHETKNPLGLVRGMAQSLHDQRTLPPEADAVALRIMDESDRIVGQINAFLDLAKSVDPALGNVEVAALLDDLASLVAADLGSKGGSLRIELDPGLCIVADVQMLRRALLNLLLNALQACGFGGKIEISARAHGNRARIAVVDNGCGIAAEDLEEVRKPYVTHFAGGTGLGLAIVDRIAHAHGWTLRIDSRAGSGATVALEEIPMARDTA